MRPFTPRELAINSAAIARALPAFTARPFLPAAWVRRYQLRELRRIVAHAYENVPLYAEKYRAAGVHPRDLRTLADWARFPTVTKAEVIDAYPMRALERSLVERGITQRSLVERGITQRGLDLGECLVSKSSGSTGVVIDVVHRATRLAVQGLALHRLLGLYAPYLPWHRFVYVYTSEYPARRLAGTYPMVWIPTLSPTADIVARLEAIRPHFLACYPSHLRALAQELGPGRCRALGLLAISVSSEPSTQRERDELGALFGCGVFDEYSTEELTRVAAQCTHGTYHLFEDVAYVEVLAPGSDAPVPEGERGEIVGTYLHNYAMPFLRYRQGDTGRVGPSRCKCGRRFRELTELGGRTLDSFVLPSGRVLTSGWLLDASYSFLFDVEADIAAFTLIQEETDRVTIEIVPGRGYGEGMSEAIAARFRELVGEPLTVDVVLRAEVRRAGGGKHHPIVSRVARRAGGIPSPA